MVCTNSYYAVEPISPAAPNSHLNRRQMSARLSKKTLFVPSTLCPQCAYTVCIILPQCEHSCTRDNNTVCILCSVQNGNFTMWRISNWLAHNFPSSLAVLLLHIAAQYVSNDHIHVQIISPIKNEWNHHQLDDNCSSDCFEGAVLSSSESKQQLWNELRAPSDMSSPVSSFITFTPILIKITILNSHFSAVHLAI